MCASDPVGTYSDTFMVNGRYPVVAQRVKIENLIVRMPNVTCVMVGHRMSNENKQALY